MNPKERLVMWLLDDVRTCAELYPYQRPEIADSRTGQPLAARITSIRLAAVLALIG